MLITKIAYALTLFRIVKCSGRLGIVGGRQVEIENFAYSAFAAIDNKRSSFVCGSSIVNQNVLMTAAHCLERATKTSEITVTVGCTNKRRGTLRYVEKTLCHERYDPAEIINDIALMFIRKPLSLGPLIKRIILMKNPPMQSIATIAGWGVIDEKNSKTTNMLHATQQKIWSRTECKKVMSDIPPGTFCAGTLQSQRYVAVGDSGSALVINDYIQIGIVSFKSPDISSSLVVYTDVANYFDWIRRNAKKLVCP